MLEGPATIPLEFTQPTVVFDRLWWYFIPELGPLPTSLGDCFALVLILFPGGTKLVLAGINHVLTAWLKGG